MKPRLFYCSAKRLSQIAPVENAIRDLNFDYQDSQFLRHMQYSHLSDEDFQLLQKEMIDELSHMNAILGTHSDRNKYFNAFKDDINFPWNNELEVPIDIYNKYMEKVSEFSEEKIAHFEEANKGQFDNLIQSYKVAYKLILKMIKHRNEQEKYLI